MKQTRKWKRIDMTSPSSDTSTNDSSASAATWSELGRDSLLAGDAREALWYLRQAVESDSECSVAWQLLGRCFEAMGEEARARRCFTLAFRLSLKASQISIGSGLEPIPIVWPRRDPRDS